LRELRDTALRQTLLRVPTALTILPMQVHQLQAAGRQALRESPEFQRLSQDLAAELETAALEEPATP
jgi:NTE family protein